MQKLMLGIVLAITLVTTALAQGYEYTASGLEYQTTVPAAAGETVTGLVKQATGMTALGQVKVEDVYFDDLFAYWVGTFNGEYYAYDAYSTYWKPLPVSYQHATLKFQDEVISGWVRSFGGWMDSDNFFGRDGIVYKRINVTRNRKRGTNRRRQVIYTYFVNLATGERSDREGMTYSVIGDAGVAAQVIEEVMAARETELAAIVDNDPAYPQWENRAQEPPDVIGVPDSVNVTDQQTLMDLIEGEVGPLTIGEDAQTEVDAEPAEEDTEA